MPFAFPPRPAPPSPSYASPPRQPRAKRRARDSPPSHPLAPSHHLALRSPPNSPVLRRLAATLARTVILLGFTPSSTEILRRAGRVPQPRAALTHDRRPDVCDGGAQGSRAWRRNPDARSARISAVASPRERGRKRDTPSNTASRNATNEPRGRSQWRARGGGEVWGEIAYCGPLRSCILSRRRLFRS